LKVVHIVRQFSPSVGGLETAVLSLARAQRSRLGIDASVITLDRVFGEDTELPHEDIVSGIPVRRLAWRGSSRYPLAPSVLRYVQDADILHVHAIDFFFDFLAFTQPLHRRVMVASTHGGFFHTAKFAFAKKLWFDTITRLSIRAYSRIGACSHSDEVLFQKRAGARLTLVENGIDQSRFADASAPFPTRTIICFGRFSRHKRVGEIFPLLARLRAQNPEWRLIVAGRDSDQTSQELAIMASKAGVADAVRFVVNPSDVELRALIGEASYFACLSAYEGFGLAAVEAMSAGLFPILSDIPPFMRLVNDTEIGLIHEFATPATTAERVCMSVLTDQTAYAARRERTMRAVRLYDWDTVAARYEEIYREAIGSEQRDAGGGDRIARLKLRRRI
jgi:alpha-1,3-mannosyltransferase